MLKYLLIAGLAALGLAAATPAEARHGRSHVSVTIGHGTPYYHDGYYAPRYYRNRAPVVYYDPYYPRYHRYRPVYYQSHYARPYRWKSRHYRGNHRGWRHQGYRARHYRHW